MNATAQAETSFGNRLLRAVITELAVLSPRYANLNSEAQAEIIDRLRDQLADEIRGLVHAVSARGYDSVAATISSVTFREGVKANLEMVKDAKGVQSLAGSVGESVMIVMCSPAAFIGGMDAVKPTANQRDWTLADDDDKDDE